MLCGGLYKPIHAAILGLIYILAKYSWGYQQSGGLSKRRISAVAICMLAVVVNSGIFLFNLYKKFKK